MAITARFERASPGSTPGEGSIFVPRWRNGSVSLLQREGPCSIQGRGTISGLSVTAAYSPRTGEAGVRLPQPGPSRGIGREVRHPASTRIRGERYPYPAPFRRRSPTEEAPRSERGQYRFESYRRHQIGRMLEWKTDASQKRGHGGSSPSPVMTAGSGSGQPGSLISS